MASTRQGGIHQDGTISRLVFGLGCVVVLGALLGWKPLGHAVLFRSETVLVLGILLAVTAYLSRNRAYASAFAGTVIGAILVNLLLVVALNVDGRPSPGQILALTASGAAIILNTRLLHTSRAGSYDTDRRTIYVFGMILGGGIITSASILSAAHTFTFSIWLRVITLNDRDTAAILGVVLILWCVAAFARRAPLAPGTALAAMVFGITIVEVYNSWTSLSAWACLAGASLSMVAGVFSGVIRRRTDDTPGELSRVREEVVPT